MARPSANHPSTPSWMDSPEQLIFSPETNETSDSELEEAYRKKPVLNFFQVIEWTTVVVGTLVIGANIWLVAILPLTLKTVVTRLFVVSFCLIAIFTELNLYGFLNELSSFENWFLKGLFYVFIGFGTLKNDEAISGGDDGGGDSGLSTTSSGLLPAEAMSAVVMVALGIIYMFLYLTCGKQVKELMEIEHRLMLEGKGEWGSNHGGGTSRASSSRRSTTEFSHVPHAQYTLHD